MIIFIEDIVSDLGLSLNTINDWTTEFGLIKKIDIDGRILYNDNVYDILIKANKFIANGLDLSQVKKELEKEIEGYNSQQMIENLIQSSTQSSCGENNTNKNKTIGLEKIPKQPLKKKVSTKKKAKEPKTKEIIEMVNTLDQESDSEITNATAEKVSRQKSNAETFNVFGEKIEDVTSYSENIIEEDRASENVIFQSMTQDDYTETIVIPKKNIESEKATSNAAEFKAIIEALILELRTYTNRVISAEKKVLLLEDYEARSNKEYFELTSEVKKLKEQINEKDKKIGEYEAQKKRLSLVEAQLKLMLIEKNKKKFWEFWK